MCWPTWPALTEDQIRPPAVHHVVPMINKVSRVAMREDRAKEIVREAVRNAAAVKPRLQKIATPAEGRPMSCMGRLGRGRTVASVVSAAEAPAWR